jgi:hypothetical protein
VVGRWKIQSKRPPTPEAQFCGNGEMSQTAEKQSSQTGVIFLGALPNFRRQSTSIFAGHGATLRQRVWPHLQAPFDCADHGSVFHSIGISHGDEPLLGTQPVNHLLLAMTEDGMRKNGKITEHPKKIHALQKRRHQITRSDWRLHLDHAISEFLNPHK